MKQNGRCKNSIPKPFLEFTKHGKNSYLLYKRPNNGRKVLVRGHELDNQWVVSCNPYLLATYDYHLNVEICSTIEAVKYLYKYIYKGHTRILYQLVAQQIDGIVDEIKNFQFERWICAPEALWQIYAFDLNQIYPAVMALQLHFEGQQSLAFNENDELENIAACDRSSRIMLTEFFRMNRSNAKVKSLQ